MTDVVEHGREPGAGTGRATGVRRAGLVLGLLLVAVLVHRCGLLSAGGLDDADRRAGAHRVVVRVDDRLVRLDRTDPTEGARLPRGFDPRADLVPVLRADGSGVLLGVHRGLLFRLAPTREATPQPIGRARAVVAASGAPGRALVLRADGVVEVEVATGRLAQPEPFPGFAQAAGWRPEGIVTAVGARSLLVSRPGPDGTGLELALAWPARRVEAGVNPPLQPLGMFRGLLGVAGDWVITAAGACPGTACRVRIVSVTRDAVLARDVAPPPGWQFVGGAEAAEALVPVRRADDGTTRGLVRLVAGGDNALLVRGTGGVDLGAGLVTDLDRSVRLVTRAADGSERLRAWRPDSPARAAPVRGGADLPRTARLVCVCG